jgi:hypothetical protein
MQAARFPMKAPNRTCQRFKPNWPPIGPRKNIGMQVFMLNIIMVNVQVLYPLALSEAGTGNRSGFSVYPFGVTIISVAMKNLPSGNRVYPIPFIQFYLHPKSAS